MVRPKGSGRCKQISLQVFPEEYDMLKRVCVEAGGISMAHLFRTLGLMMTDKETRNDVLRRWIDARI
jgi:hypothetical protein